jgi:hypothetical protein
VASDFARHGLEAAHDGSNGLGVLDALVVVYDPVGGLFFARAAQLAHDDDGFCVVVFLKHLQCVDKVCSRNHITAHANAQALPHAGSGQRSDCFVRERPRLCYDADVAWGESGERLEPNAAAPNG